MAATSGPPFQFWYINEANNSAGIILKICLYHMGRDSSVGIAVRYGLDGPGTCPDRLWSLPSFLYNGYRVLPGGKAAGAWC